MLISNTFKTARNSNLPNRIRPQDHVKHKSSMIPRELNWIYRWIASLHYLNIIYWGQNVYRSKRQCNRRAVLYVLPGTRCLCCTLALIEEFSTLKMAAESFLKKVAPYLRNYMSHQRKRYPWILVLLPLRKSMAYLCCQFQKNVIN